MKFTKAAFIALFITGSLFSACLSYAQFIDNIDELVLLDDVVQCKKCHKEHGAEWPKSAHAGSVSDLKTLKAFKRYIEFNQKSPYDKSGIDLRDNCFTCHAPRVKNASEHLLEDISGLIVTAVDNRGTVNGQLALKEISKISIDCGVCHMVNGMPEGEVEPNMIYGPGWDEHEIAHTRDHGFDTIGSPYLMSSKMCTRCHNDSLAGVSSIVKKMHKSSLSHYMKAERSNKTCQSCHMMDGDMIIHNMPIYSGTLNFPVEKTADKIGLFMACMTVLGIFLSVISKAYLTRTQKKRAMGIKTSESFEIMPAINAEEMCPHEAKAAVKEENTLESDKNTNIESH